MTAPIRAALLLALALLAPPAAATQDGWPALHDVTGVAPGDVLNVRAGPGTQYAILGTLAPDAVDVEVIGPAPQDPWALVSLGPEGGIGYVSLRFLQRQPNTFAGHLPPVLACAGAEPFWSLRVEGDRIDYADLAAETEIAFFGIETLETGRPGAMPVLRAFEGEAGVTMVLANEVGFGAVSLPKGGTGGLCSDGMSDRLYGVSVTAVIASGGTARARTGCCAFAGR